MNINLHRFTSKDLNLGLLRIVGSCNAEKLVDLVTVHLNSFGISYQHDVVGATSDGAAVMLTFGSQSPCIYQICLNHGLHLGVIKTFYKQSLVGHVNSSNCIDFSGKSDDFSDADTEYEDETMEFQNNSKENNLQYVRTIVIFFKSSTVRSDTLKQKLREKSLKEQQLLLDCKTRWNSMLKMFDKLLILIDIIEETLGLNINLLKSLGDALKPVEIAVNAMSEKKNFKNCNFMREKLVEQENDISEALLENINFYINQRLNDTLKDLIQSLNNFEKVPSKSSITLATDLMKIMFSQKEVSIEVPLQEGSLNYQKMSLEEELIQIQLTPKVLKIHQEFSLSKANGKLTENLSRLYNALNKIRPTSIDSELTFSVANNFCAKLRSKLSDQALSNFVFLKYYFLNIEK